MDFFNELEARKPEASMALGLERITLALKELGHPEKKLPVILVAGTNGKGSTSTFIAHYLQQAGKKVGLFTSPHLFHPAERLMIDRQTISVDELERRLRPFAERFSSLTYFELFTLVAFSWFVEQQVDFAVLEIGLGGRLDATNAAQHVLATVITTIGLDHQHILGSTEVEIARQKAGILRNNTPLWLGKMAPAAKAEILRVADEVGAKVRPTVEDLRLPALDAPKYLLDNLSLATAVASFLLQTTIVAKQEDLLVKPHGRWSILRQNPLKIVDGAHNPAGIAALVSALKHVTNERLVVYVRMGKTKDAKAMLEILTTQLALAEIWFIEEDDRNHWWHSDELRPFVKNTAVWASNLAQTTQHFLTQTQASVWTGSLRGLDVFANILVG